MTAIEDGTMGWLREHAPWLFAPELGVFLVGTGALALALQRRGAAGPKPRDVDLAWLCDIEEGRRVLEHHGVLIATTEGNLERGTLAMKLDGRRVEVTTLRDGQHGMPLAERIARDLNARDMTAGAVAVGLADHSIHDPTGGVDDFLAARIVAVGDPAERVREHPARWLRYYRKAHEWGFELDSRIRKLREPRSLLAESPREALAQEIRAALLHCASPGRFLQDLHEAGLLQILSPELDLQFDGRPAGPQRWHPEISQSLHLILALEWAHRNAADLDERERLMLMFAVLVHDLGKGLTDPNEMPGHHGHERAGVALVDRVLSSLPGLVDNLGRTLARAVCELHLQVRKLDDQRPGTLARLYDSWLRRRDFPLRLFALSVAADTAGRLGYEFRDTSEADRLVEDLSRLRDQCASVDAAALRAQHEDIESFRMALHEARARAIRTARGRA